MEADQRKLYDLIWKRTLASQMASAKMESTTIDISSEDSQISLRSTGTVVLFEGFLKVYEEGRDDEVVDDSDKLLPQLSVGDKTDKITITSKPTFYTTTTSLHRGKFS